MSRNKSFSIGLVIDQEASAWIAGTLHVMNIAMALDSVREERDLKLHLIVPQGYDMEFVRPFIDVFQEVHFFSKTQDQSAGPFVKYLQKRVPFFRAQTLSLKSTIDTFVDVILPVLNPLSFDCEKPWVTWIPDFQHRRCPQFFSEKEQKVRDSVFSRLILESSHMLVSSQDACNDLMTYYHREAESEKISVYRFCTFPDDRWFVGNPREVCRKLELPEKFLMFPSQSWKHKNHMTLFKAILKLKNAGHDDLKLVLTGHESDYRHPHHSDDLKQFIREHDLGSQVRHLGLIPRTEQVQLLRAAAAIIQPSLFEGWSMLVEDCRTLGKMVYLSDIPVHREQDYPEAIYFDPESPEELANLIKKDWPLLQPGPVEENEQRARKQAIELNKANGHLLVEILARMTEKEV